MSLAIGFTNKYFTLWSVDSEDTFATAPNGTHYKSGITTNFFYHQNLSMNKDQAIAKAKEMGCTDLEPSEDLYGRKNSWSNFIPNNEPIPTWEDYQFTYGKYRGEDIRENTDLKYLNWYECDADSIEARKRICELDSDYFMEDEMMLHKSVLIARKIKNGKIKVIAVSNFQVLPEYNEASVKIQISNPKNDEEQDFNNNNDWGYRLTLDLKKINEQLDLQQRSYQGNNYSVPKGKRSFKKTEFTINKNKITLKD